MTARSRKRSFPSPILLKARWFALSDRRRRIPAHVLPEWNEQTALEALRIERVPFEDLDGNTQGYALRGQKIAVSPIAENPSRTLFHELGHQLLGHCDEADLTDTEMTPRDIREMEAEAVALLCCESLGLPGAESSRGYVGKAVMWRSTSTVASCKGLASAERHISPLELGQECQQVGVVAPALPFFSWSRTC